MNKYTLGCVECGKTWRISKDRFAKYLHLHWLFIELDHPEIDGQMYCNECVSIAKQIHNKMYI